MLVGGRGDDVICGAGGNDIVYGGRGNDIVSGGPGNDRVSGNKGDDTLDGDDGNDRLFGGAGIDTIDAGSGNDIVYGGRGNDIVSGGPGNDRVSGNKGDDTLDGGDGNDRLFGGAGTDVCDGGPGTNTIRTCETASADEAWARQLGGTSSETGFGVAVDGAGNVYTTGNFSGTADFDPGPGVFNLTSSGSGDVFVSKLNRAGDFVWARQLGGINFETGFGVAVDGDGNVYTTGYFSGTADFDPGPGVFHLTSAGNSSDAFVWKLDRAGDFVWARQFGSTSGEQGFGVAVDGDGNVYTTGEFGGAVDFDPGPGVFHLTSAGFGDVFVSKLDRAGDFVWARQFGGTSGEQGFGVAVDGDGNVYTTGRFVETADFDPGPGVFNLTPAGFDDAFVSKLNRAGHFVWARQLGGTDFETGFGVAVDGDGNVYTIGNFSGMVDFDPGPGVLNLTSAGGFDVFMWKLDRAGDLVWARQLGGASLDEGRGVAVDSAGNVYTTGNFSGRVDFDPGPGVFNLTSAGGFDVFVSKLDRAGDFVWARQLGGTGPETGFGVAVDSAGTVYTTGRFLGTVDFDPGPGVFNLTSGLRDVFVSKLDRAGNLS